MDKIKIVVTHPAVYDHDSKVLPLGLQEVEEAFGEKLIKRGVATRPGDENVKAGDEDKDLKKALSSTKRKLTAANKANETATSALKIANDKVKALEKANKELTEAIAAQAKTK
jgi:hypothetical protein